MIPQDLKYSEDHEWIRSDGNKVVIGITHHAQDQLGDIVYVEVPEVGRELTAGEVFGVVESVKTVSDLFSPVSGKVLKSNPSLVESGDSFEPELINKSPYGEGWMIEVEVSDVEALSALLDHEGYQAVVDSES